MHRPASLCFSMVLGAITCLACEEKPAPQSESSVSSALAAAAPATPAPTPAPSAAAEIPPQVPKPKKRIEDCPKGPKFEFASKELEFEVRRKLPKPEGPITFADLRRVRSLNLSQIKLSELDVCFFSQLKGVKELFLGPGEYDDLSPLGGSTQLESLRASISQVRDLTPLEKLTRMDRLDLGRTQISDITPLSAMTKLTELQLDDTPVQDLSPLAKLTSLETLSVKRTRVKDASALKDLKQLKFLYIGGSPLEEDPTAVAPIRANGTKVIAE